MKHRTGHLYQRGDKFWLQYRVEGRMIRQSLDTTDRDEAETKQKKIMRPFQAADLASAHAIVESQLRSAETKAQTANEDANPPLAVTDSWDAYKAATERPDSGAKTLRQYESHVDQFLAWMKEQHATVILMRDVSKDMADAYAAHLAKRGLSANRFNKHIRFLELMFRALYDKARLTVNPWEKIRRKRQTAQSRRELTIDELRRVCSATKGEMRLLLAIGIYTGLRLGDATTLRWGEVDLKRAMIQRIPNKTASRNPKPIHIPIHATLAAILNELPQKSRGDYVLPETAENYLHDPSIVTNNVRTLMEANGISVHKPGTGFKTVTDADGKETQVHSGTRACVEVGFHSLRHTFVSMCREANAPLSVVESLVGHSNPTMTRLYSHTSELAAMSTVNLLPSVMGDATTPLALPAPQADIREQVRALAGKSEIPDKLPAGVVKVLEGMNARNWSKVRDELLNRNPA